MTDGALYSFFRNFVIISHASTTDIDKILKKGDNLVVSNLITQMEYIRFGKTKNEGKSGGRIGKSFSLLPLSQILYVLKHDRPTSMTSVQYF